MPGDVTCATAMPAADACASAAIAMIDAKRRAIGIRPQ
jgi:hypothetical protein